MTAWENLQLGPILGWRHLLRSRTAAFARLPLGRFTPFTASTTSARDPQSLAAHLVGFPLPPIEALSDEDPAQAQTFTTTWLTEPPTPPRSPQNLHPRSHQPSSVESVKAAAAGPNAVPALPERPLAIAQHQRLKSTDPLGQKAAAMTTQLFRDRFSAPSNPNGQTTTPHNTPPLQAKLSPLRSSPDSLLPKTPDALPTTHPSFNVPDASASEIAEANEQSLNDAAPETDSRAAVNLDGAIAPESLSDALVPSNADMAQARADTPDVRDGLPDSEESTPSQADSATPQEQLPVAAAALEVTDLDTSVDEIPGWEDASHEDASHLAQPSRLRNLETTPEQSDSAPDAASSSSSDSPFIQARTVPTEATPASLPSTPQTRETPPLQRHTLAPPEGETSEPVSSPTPESVPESFPSQPPNIEPPQATIPAANAPPMPRQMLDLPERQDSESPSPDLPPSKAQESDTHTSATVESASSTIPTRPEWQDSVSNTAAKLAPSTNQRTVQRAAEPTPTSELRGPDMEAGQDTNSMPSAGRDRDRAAPDPDVSPSKPPSSSSAPPSDPIPLLPSIQAHLNSQTAAPAKRLSPHFPLATLDTYQLQPATQANQPSPSSAPKRHNPDRSPASRVNNQPVTTSPQQASPQPTWPLQLKTLDSAASDTWEDPFGVEPDLANRGLEDLATDTADIDLETALEADAEPDAATGEAPSEDSTDSPLEDASPAATNAVTLTAGKADTSDDEALLDYLAEWVYGELRSHLSRSQEAHYGIQSSLSLWYPQHPGFFTQTARSDPNFPTFRLRSGQALPLPPKLLQLTTLVRQQVESRLRQNWQRAPDRF